MSFDRTTAAAVTITLVFAGWAVRGLAQRQPPPPQIPQPIYRAPEDTRKTGIKPEDIKAGVRPDYTKLRETLVTIPVQGNIYLVGGAGANVAVQISDEGTLVVDTGDAAATDKLQAEIDKLKVRPVRWIINTSGDADHTGGNARIAKAGVGAPAGGGGGGGGGGAGGAGGGGGAPAGSSIIAFEKTLNRMSAPTGQQSSRPTDDWPTDTFFTERKNFWYGDEPIEMWNIAAAHSDGDVVVFFRRSDVIVAGDILTVDRYPYFDVNKGGSIQGIINGLNRIVGTAVPETYNQQGGTRIVPGHGRIMNQSDVVEYRDMATIVRDRIAALAKQGKTIEQVKSARPTLDYDGNYGSTTGPWTTDMFIEAVYKEVAPKPAAPAGRRPSGRATRN